MALQTWVTLINAYQPSSIATPVAYKSSKVITDISPGAAKEGALKIPENFLQVGSILRFIASGWFGTTAKPTLILGLYYGGVAGKALAVTAANETPETVTEVPWSLEATTRIVAGGEKGKAITQGTVFGVTTPAAKTTAGVTAQFLPATKPQTEVEINLNKAEILTLGATWGAESASNTITCLHWLVELLN